MNILFTCVGRRNYLVNYFKEALNGNGTVIGTDASDLAPALAECDKKIVVPRVSEDSYIPTILDICTKNDVKLVVSLNDLDLPVLSANAEKFEEIGVELAVSNKDIIDICFDKSKTEKFLRSIGLKTAISYFTPEEALEAVSKAEASFPMVVKPRWGSGSIRLELVENAKQLELAYALSKEKITSTILGRVSQTDINKCLVIQPALKGEEYGMDIVNNFNCDNVGVFVKRKIRMRAGETDMAQSCRNEKIEEIGKIIAKHLRHKGMLDCDLFWDGKDAYIIDMNPRFGGGYPFTNCAGVNVPKAYLNWAIGKSAPSDCFEFIPEMTFSKCDRLVRVK